MLIQHRLIARVREVCAGDERLDAALMYGSFAQGAGDEHSDIEFWLFFRPGERPDPHEWCAQLGPLLAVVPNEFGAHVAFFAPLVRGEFHFATTSDIPSVGGWPARGADVDAMLVKDRGGRLRPVLEALPEHASPGDAAELCGRFANWVVLAHHVAARGETLRAWDALGHVHRHLLWLARLGTGRTGTWLTPSRHAETDLPPALASTTAAADPVQLRAALREAWRQGHDLWVRAAQRHRFRVPEALVSAIEQALTEPGAWVALDSVERRRWSRAARARHRGDVPDRPAGSTFHLDGRHVTDVAGFFCALGEAVNGPGGYFGSGPDALADCASGGWGATVPFRLVWHDADVARTHLGEHFDQILRWLRDDGIDVGLS